MNARRSPGRILGNRTEDQGANLFADTLPSSYLSDSGEPCPIQTKPRSMPVQDGSWRDRKSTRLNSSHVSTSYAVFCLKKKTIKTSFTTRLRLLSRCNFT